MTRKERKQFLEDLEELITSEQTKKNHSKGNILWYIITFSGFTAAKIKRLARYVHPWDYKDKYPNAVELFTRVCRPSEKTKWGYKVETMCKEKNPGVVGVLCERPRELKKRLPNLIRRKYVNESNIEHILETLFASDISERELVDLKNKIKKLKTPETEAICFSIDSVLLINKNKETI